MVKILCVIVFLILLVVGHMYANFHSLSYKRWSAGIGVFAILFLCEYLSNIIFKVKAGNIGLKRTSLHSVAIWVVSTVSYASMACYMFHRLFFWMGEQVWTPSVIWIKWLYMGAVVFPLMLVLSYYIQRYYDLLIKNV